MDGNVARIEELKNAYNILVGKPEGKRPLGRPRRRGEDKIRKVRLAVVNWIHLDQDRGQWRAPLYKVMNLWVP
jgi:hypothetical protein